MGMFDDIINNVGEPYVGKGKGFAHGTHAVVIGTVTPCEKKTKNNPKAEVIEVEVFNKDDQDQKATATLYFHTEGGAKIAVTKVLGLLVHKVSEDKKEAVRKLGKKLFGEISDPTEARDVAAKLMTDKLIGEEAFLVVEIDEDSKYDTSMYGDIWHYPYELPDADERMDKAADAKMDMSKAGDVKAEEVPDFDEDDL